MFRDKARLLGFAPENGMLVLAYGRATLYERDGAFQLYCDYMRPFGAGAAQMAFDALKKKLSAEGLFDAEHKRPLPPMPQCIGLVTSKTGAALQDVIHIITRRWPMVKLLLAPVSVQGLEAEKSIVDGIRRLDADPRPDIILITRGGGSKEDLWVFNSERIARAAYACKSQSFLRSGMKLIPQFWIMWLTCVLLHLPQRRNSACRIRHRCGTKYSFYNKIFKKYTVPPGNVL